MAAGECQGWPSSRLPWTVSDQPSGCWMMRAGSDANREACRAGVMAANACPRRASASMTYTTVWRSRGGGGGVSAKCEVMGFCLKLATSKKGCAQLKFSKTRRGGLPWMCTSAYFPIFWACRKKFGGVLLQK